MGVPTKGVKFKFSTSDKVLCYEPDPTKARVLYESKVLDLVVNKDKNGKRVPEYLIHFLGWNSSWDRYVGEELILPFTEENQQLQAKLLKEAELSGKGKRKTKLTNVAKETKCPPENQRELTEPEKMESESDSEDEIETEVHIELNDVLKKQLEKDHCLVTKNNKVVRLPSDPNVVSILEDFVRQLASRLLYVSPPRAPQCLPHDVKQKLDVCKEVVDGIRVCFDFTLPHLLLYGQEAPQLARLQLTALNLRNAEANQWRPRGRGRPKKPTNGAAAKSPERKTPKASTRVLRSSDDQLKRVPELAPSSHSSSSEAACQSQLRSNLLRELEEWRLLPPSPHDLPSLVYGSHHLLRLFVKLPELISNMKISKRKVRMLLDVIQSFLAYLTEKVDVLFSPCHYIDAAVS